ncbi:unnamed protein product [Mytilus coruscus]|uniref:Uncharacterized protein n=1 Tax=Mytilus coruscus TaxID=42192 RepID=A0A6J8CFV5_MYTCO|nr:unnamed protein product [Mytilus coruscus]
MRIQDQSYTQELIVVHSYDVTDKSYTVTGTLNLVPSSDKSGQNLCCDVSHLFNNKVPQSVCLQLTINGSKLGRGKKRENANSTYLSQQTIISNQNDSTGNPQHRNGDIDCDGLDPNRQEMHVYKTPEDDYSPHMMVPADNTYFQPISTVRSIP